MNNSNRHFDIIQPITEPPQIIQPANRQLYSIPKWKHITSEDEYLNSKYEVSYNGKVRNTFTNNELTVHTNNDGYKWVSLLYPKREKKPIKARYIHRLVESAYDYNILDLPIVNHKDQNPANNNFNNLEWCDIQYNNTYNDAHIKRGLPCRGNEPWNKGKKMNEEFRKKIAKAMTGKKLSEEHKKKISDGVIAYYTKR